MAEEQKRRETVLTVTEETETIENTFSASAIATVTLSGGLRRRLSRLVIGRPCCVFDLEPINCKTPSIPPPVTAVTFAKTIC